MRFFLQIQFCENYFQLFGRLTPIRTSNGLFVTKNTNNCVLYSYISKKKRRKKLVCSENVKQKKTIFKKKRVVKNKKSSRFSDTPSVLFLLPKWAWVKIKLMLCIWINSCCSSFCFPPYSHLISYIPHLTPPILNSQFLISSPP